MCVCVCVCVCVSKKSENTTLPLCKVQHQSKFLWHDVKFSSVKIKFCTEAITIRITKRLRVREGKRGAKRRARTHTHTRNPKAGDPITPRKKILKKTNRNRNKQATKWNKKIWLFVILVLNTYRVSEERASLQFSLDWQRSVWRQGDRPLSNAAPNFRWKQNKIKLWMPVTEKQKTAACFT